MKSQAGFGKKDVVVFLGCVIFLAANIGAIGSRGRRRAKEAVCLSNLRQWGICFQMYAYDNDGYFPRGWWSSGWTAYGPPMNYRDYWMEALRPYYGNEHRLRCCPEAMRPSSDVGGLSAGGGGLIDATEYAWGIFPGPPGQMSTWWNMVAGGDYGSYGWNGFICNPPADIIDIGGGHLTKFNWRTLNIAGAYNIPLFSANQWIDGWPEPEDEPPEHRGMPWGGPSDMRRFCQDRHNGYVNVLFLDFSARKVGLKELWTLKWHRGYDTEGPWTKAGGVEPNDWPGWMRGFEDY